MKTITLITCLILIYIVYRILKTAKNEKQAVLDLIKEKPYPKIKFSKLCKERADIILDDYRMICTLEIKQGYCNILMYNFLKHLSKSDRTREVKLYNIRYYLKKWYGL